MIVLDISTRRCLFEVKERETAREHQYSIISFESTLMTDKPFDLGTA